MKIFLSFARYFQLKALMVNRADLGGCLEPLHDSKKRHDKKYVKKSRYDGLKKDKNLKPDNCE